MLLSEIIYVTGNRGKYHEASLILADWPLRQLDLSLEEIQGNSVQVVTHKAIEAGKQLAVPFIVEDVSLCCTALNGLPGPYIKDFLTQLTEQGLADLVLRYEDHAAQAICTVAYSEQGQDLAIFEGIVQGKIVHPRGQTKIGKASFNPIFQPDGADKTQGEMTLEEHSKRSHRFLALHALRNYLQARHDR